MAILIGSSKITKIHDQKIREDQFYLNFVCDDDFNTKLIAWIIIWIRYWILSRKLFIKNLIFYNFKNIIVPYTGWKEGEGMIWFPIKSGYGVPQCCKKFQWGYTLLYFIGNVYEQYFLNIFWGYFLNPLSVAFSHVWTQPK